MDLYCSCVILSLFGMVSVRNIMQNPYCMQVQGSTPKALTVKFVLGICYQFLFSLAYYIVVFCNHCFQFASIIEPCCQEINTFIDFKSWIFVSVKYAPSRYKHYIKGPQSAIPLFLFTCENLAIIFYSEPVKTKKNHCETTQYN